MIQLKFKGWRATALHSKAHVTRWLGSVADGMRDVFRQGMLGPHTGRVYRRRGRVHQASVNRRRAEYPASDTGRLLASLRAESTDRTARVGTGAPYAAYLRSGTSRMKRRKMSDDALDEGYKSTRQGVRGWVSWQKGKKKR